MKKSGRGSSAARLQQRRARRLREAQPRLVSLKRVKAEGKARDGEEDQIIGRRETHPPPRASLGISTIHPAQEDQMGNIHRSKNAYKEIGITLIGKTCYNSRLATLEVQMQVEEEVLDLVTEVHGQAKVHYIEF